MYQSTQKISSTNIANFLLKNRGVVSYAILAVALGGFEMFNFSTTQVALSDLLGPMSFAGLQWATILAIAFCGIDFAGVARLFTGDDIETSNEVKYLFGAWLLAATMNALLTWWGVSMALQGHQLQSTSIIDKKLMMQAVPIFVAIMVWVTRVLLIGSFSMIGRRPHPRESHSQYNRPSSNMRPQQQQLSRPSAIHSTNSNFERAQSPVASSTRPQPLPSSSPLRTSIPAHPEPEYVSDGDAVQGSALPALRPMTASARPATNNQERRF